MYERRSKLKAADGHERDGPFEMAEDRASGRAA
jgi:hypothetical protein